MKQILKLASVLLSVLTVWGCNPSGQDQQMETEVLIIGGTTSGISAGIQAARLGASTLIVEETPWLGGMLTAAGVSATDGNHYLSSGIWNEFRGYLRDYYGGMAALATGWVSHTQFEPHVGDSIFKAMAAAEPGLKVIHGYYLTGILKEGNKVTGALFANDKKQQISVRAKVVVDATDLGDGLKMAGAAYRLGMDSKNETGEVNAPEQASDIVQDLTWVAILEDYGKDADKTIPKPEGYDPAAFRGCCDMTVDSTAINCDKMLDYAKLPHNKLMINWPKKGNDIYLNVVDMDRESRNKELLKAKNRTLCFVYYIQHELGYKHLGLSESEFPTSDLLALVPYHREGRRLKGIVTLNYNHVEKPYEQKEALYRTGVSVGDYPVDHHHKCNPAAPDLYFLPVPSFSIPLGSLIPETVDGLIVADKAISVTNLINGSTRLQPCVLLTGQAAGALAALSVKNDNQPRQVPVRIVQTALLDAGAYIMPLYDVNPEDKDFKVIQRIAATGILSTKGEPYKWANRTWFYPDTTISVHEFTKGLNAYDSGVNVVESEAVLTITDVNILLSGMIGRNVEEDVLKYWPELSSRSFGKKLQINKREVACLLDMILHPFETEIDFNGHFLHKN